MNMNRFLPGTIIICRSNHQIVNFSFGLSLS